METMKNEEARDFRIQLQEARENALKDAEAFDVIIHVVERLGSYIYKRVGDLGKYKLVLSKLAAVSPLSTDVPAQWRTVHTPFDQLYDMVTSARNDALHIGAKARHLTIHAIELSLILEDALRIHEDDKHVSDYMIPNPICAYLWQPISLVRQRMLTNSFSYLPIQNAENNWCLISDLQIAMYLQSSEKENDNERKIERKQRMAKSLGDVAEIELIPATCVSNNTLIAEALTDLNHKPLLIVRENEKTDLVGILTAFDLL